MRLSSSSSAYRHTRIAVAMTAPSRASAGKLRTNRCCYSPVKPITSKWASRTRSPLRTALSNQPVRRFSELLVHQMGTGLADGIAQGGAGPDEFRTAPLWGVGQRIFFLHDGRTQNLINAIRFHASQGSEANLVVVNFLRLSTQDQQDLINFLRSL